MKKRPLLVLPMFLLTACSTTNFTCEEGFAKTEKDGGILIICDNPEFEFSCDARSYSRIGDKYSCSSFNGDRYSVVDKSSTQVEAKEEDVIEEPKQPASQKVTPPKEVPKKVEAPKKKVTMRECQFTDWDCDKWNECRNSTQKRGCRLATSTCAEGVTPVQERKCELRSCVANDWNCTSWEKCKKGKQIRGCTLSSAQCKGSAAAKPTTVQNCIETYTEKEKWALMEAYKIFDKLFWSMMKVSKVVQNDGELYAAMLMTIDQYNDALNEMERYIKITQIRKLTEKEDLDFKRSVSELSRWTKQWNELRSVINTNIPYVDPVLPLPYSPPPLPSVPNKTHQQICDRISAEAALRGGFGSLSVAQEQYAAGCITLDQWCNGHALAGSLPAECK